MLFKVPVEYTVYGEVEVEAKDKEHLLSLLADPEFVYEMPLPSDTKYMSDSYVINHDLLNHELKENPVTFRLYARIEFDRPIEKNKHYLSFGGYNMTMCGRNISFDFEEYAGYIDEDDARFINISHKNPDYSSYEDLNHVTEKMLNNVTFIHDFFVYTGENGEEEINPVKIHAVSFVVFNNGTTTEIKVPQEVLARFKFDNE